MMYERMTHFVAFSTLNAGNLLQVHFTYSRDSSWISAQPSSWLLAPILGNFFYAGVSGEALRRNSLPFHCYGSSALRAFHFLHLLLKYNY